MARKPRQKFGGLELSKRDQDLVDKTAGEGGLSQTTQQKTKAAAKPAPAKPVNKTTKTLVSQPPKPSVTFTAKDLRCYIRKDSLLAAALVDQVTSLDPVAQRLVVPSTVLKQFITDNDEMLAELFRTNNALK